MPSTNLNMRIRIGSESVNPGDSAATLRLNRKISNSNLLNNL